MAGTLRQSCLRWRASSTVPCRGAPHRYAFHGLRLADSTGYAYDGAGRLRRVVWQSGDSVVYRYTVAGDLDTMRVYWRTSAAPRSETWRFTWDGLGRRRIIHYPFNQMTVQYSYDRLGTLRRVLSSNPGSSIDSDRFEVTLRQDSVDVLGRPLNQRVQCIGVPGVAWPCGDWLPLTTSNRFNRLGALAIQERIAAGVARDTMRYDRSGNQIRRRSGFGPWVSEMIYPALSNRLAARHDSAAGRPGHGEVTYDYDGAGNRLRQAKPDDLVGWQYDGLSRLVGSVSVSDFVPLTTHFNECRWDAAWRLAQPCGNGGQLALMGLNVTRSSLGWFFVHAPGIDEALLLPALPVPNKVREVQRRDRPDRQFLREQAAPGGDRWPGPIDCHRRLVGTDYRSVRGERPRPELVAGLS